MINVKLVTLNEPCNACIIISNLIKEMFKQLAVDLPYVNFQVVELTHMKEVTKIKGIEVEKMPIILINDEQLTAGSLPDQKMLRQSIEEEGYD